MDSCINDTHCVGGMHCVKGKCEGLAENATCVVPVSRQYWGKTRYVCAAGLVCSAAEKMCVPAKKAGEPCGDGCASELVCNKGTCVAMLSVAVGGACDSALACAESAVCENGVCVAGEAHKTVACTSDAQCKEGTNGKCEVCSHVSGKRYCGATTRSTDCHAEWKKAYTCWAEKHCAPVPSSNLDTCSQDACPAETNAVLSCKSNCWVYRKSYDVCAASELLRNCPLIPTWARILIAFGILIAIITIVFVIYTVARKMKTKDYIPVNEPK
jgi:hypothetical protein